MRMKTKTSIDPGAPRRATNLSINQDLLDEARALKINLSRACELGLRLQIDEVMAKRWRDENADAITSSNQYVERQGLPLSRFRTF